MSEHFEATVLASLKTIEEQVAKMNAFIAKAEKQHIHQGVELMNELMPTIPPETVEKLGVVAFGADPKMPWFKLGLACGKTVSVKKTDVDLRLRVRDGGDGSLLSEVNVPLNGLNAALNAIAG